MIYLVCFAAVFMIVVVDVKFGGHSVPSLNCFYCTYYIVNICFYRMELMNLPLYRYLHTPSISQGHLRAGLKTHLFNQAYTSL